jgi:hypothetical protein
LHRTPLKSGKFQIHGNLGNVLATAGRKELYSQFSKAFSGKNYSINIILQSFNKVRVGGGPYPI